MGSLSYLKVDVSNTQRPTCLFQSAEPITKYHRLIILSRKVYVGGGRETSSNLQRGRVAAGVPSRLGDFCCRHCTVSMSVGALVVEFRQATEVAPVVDELVIRVDMLALY